MVRTYVRLTDRQVQELRAEARRRGVSVAEHIRRCIETVLSSDERGRRQLYARAATLAGKFEGRRGAKNVARRHDAYLDEAFE